MAEKQVQEKPKTKISVHDFYFETPLYEVIAFENIDGDIFDGEVDAYSSRNGFDTTYTIRQDNMNDGYASYWNGYDQIKLTCKRRGEQDILRFIVLSDDTHVVKVGQYPSLADLQFAELGKKYDKLLAREDLQEFKKAIGLSAHGVGAGSFVYLRRIFEKLINQTFSENKADVGITKDDFDKKRMDEKVSALKKYLPSQLVEMKAVYGILSKGVHELTEQECLTYFPALKLSIELILDQRIEQDLKNMRDEQAKKQIDEIQQKLNSDKET